MVRGMLALTVLLFACLQAEAGRGACGGSVACPVPGGDYRIVLPAGEAKGAYVYFHGYMGSAEDQMRQTALVDTVLAHHLAFVALDGYQGSWSVRGGPEKSRDDLAYLRLVLADLGRSHGFRPANTLIGGFSLGASMAWYAACDEGGRFAGMLTFSGVFWDPLPRPTDCAAALPPMIHVHGRADGTFPLAGRAIGASHHQGDTFKSIALYRQRAACAAPVPRRPVVADLDCTVASGCRRGDSMLCLHAGGHVVRVSDLDAALTALGYPVAR
ncbi:poly(3-hydroxybutyrate) depolymerase [Rhizobium rhizosphaerae]|uniref:Poly(3-hydroxybutyrate) depolymerase n=1 Tax=Xaviernesmea rhizosphaerae TaxID=1672749 RepID=A0ABX3P8E0_9HYPH|nr:poly(3-hydroxybutyrate) depolymerase [Xaviernesmea rhizosphaerae]OQP83661.1 poly(3-hydroxybutyrate) depolymerase [Xaviernesmea rhizosphaerae]